MKFDIEKLYKKYYFEKRYLNLDDFYSFINVNFPNKEEIGRSTQNNPIYLLKFGNGTKKVLIWSQMHGNESTGTYAMFDFLELFSNLPNDFKENLYQNFEIHFIPVLNPDGAIIWDRRNALGIDINRDYNAEHSVEIKILKHQFINVKYNLGFNLHDQRSIFSVGNHLLPATLSFLSPATDLERSLNNTRKQSMGIINYICKLLQMYIKNQIGRYSDEFYPNSTGDNFQKEGIPVVLFEAGHFINNYSRSETRKYFCLAIYFAFEFILNNENWATNYEDYFLIPENKEGFFDVIIRNCKFNIHDKIYYTDLAIQYSEKVNSTKTDLDFIPYIIEIGDLSKKNAWKEISGENFKTQKNPLKIGDLFEFQKYIK